MKPNAYVFMGRYGAGKGTQAELLIKKLNSLQPDMKVIHVETGKEFRNYSQEKEYTSELTKRTIDSGALMPVFMCVLMWGKRLAKEFTGKEHVVFDGTPRKLAEAVMLEELFPFYGLGKPWVIYLDVEHDESHKRLTLRARSSGRADDSSQAIEKRREAYEKDIVPAIEYYRKDPNVNFLDVDGERPIEEIHADIVKRIGLA